MIDIKNYILKDTGSAKDALQTLDKLGIAGAVLFVINKKRQVIGTVTDGDIRRGLLGKLKFKDDVVKFMKKDFTYIQGPNFDSHLFKNFQINDLREIPVLDDKKRLLKIIDLSKIKALLPVDAVIMAGGRGKRLMPLTKDNPKSLLKVGDRPIIDHIIENLILYGIMNIHITIKYLGHMIKEHVSKLDLNGTNVNYYKEDKPLGTIGGLGNINEFVHDNILLMNGDLLTNLDLDEFFEHFIEEDADMSVASFPYHIKIPYAVFDFKGKDNIIAIKEKPNFTYYANAGIYLIKRSMLNLIPKNKKFDATALLEMMIQKGKKVVSFPIQGYWFDIGDLEDFIDAQDDVRKLHIK